MCTSTRLKECCCGCSVRTGTLITLWLDATLSALMGMLFLIVGHGMRAGIDMFKSLAQYAYNGAKFFYHQSKSFGGDVNIEDFEAVLRASQQIDPLIEHHAKTICSFLFYLNAFLILVAVMGMIAVYQRKQFLLLLCGAVKVIETLATLFVVSFTCMRMPLPLFWLVAFPGAINIALKIYGTAVLHSHWSEMIQYSADEDNSTDTSEEDIEIAKKKSLHANSYDQQSYDRSHSQKTMDL